MSSTSPGFTCMSLSEWARNLNRRHFRLVTKKNVLFVKNLPFGMSVSELMMIFAEVGDVVDVRIIHVGKNTNIYGFIRMMTEASACKSIEKFNGKRLFGRRLTVEFAENFKTICACKYCKESDEKWYWKKVYPPISVDVIFEVVNGLLGLMRDIILRLCDLSYQKQNVCAIIGIGQENLAFLKHRWFISSLEKNYGKKMDYSLYSDLEGNIALTNTNTSTSTSSGINSTSTVASSTTTASTIASHSFPLLTSLYTFPDADVCQAIFVDKPITDGVWEWNMRIKYGSDEKKSSFYIGVAPHNSPHRTKFGFNFWKTSSGFSKSELGSDLFGVNWTRYADEEFPWMWRESTRPDCVFHYAYGSDSSMGGFSVFGTTDIPTTETPVPDNSLVTMEVDLKGGALNFFVDERKVPRTILFECSLFAAAPHVVAVEGRRSLFTPLSLCRRGNPRRSPVMCRFHNCNCE